MFFAVNKANYDCIAVSDNERTVIKEALDYCDEDEEIIIFEAKEYGKVYVPKQPVPVFTQDLNAE